MIFQTGYIKSTVDFPPYNLVCGMGNDQLDVFFDVQDIPKVIKLAHLTENLYSTEWHRYSPPDAASGKSYYYCQDTLLGHLNDIQKGL